MQPMPHPDSWLIEWVVGMKLATPEQIRDAQRRLEIERANTPLLQAQPTLGGRLERDGLLTREQREAGEREANARQASFAAWRSQTMRDQERKPPPG